MHLQTKLATLQTRNGACSTSIRRQIVEAWLALHSVSCSNSALRTWHAMKPRRYRTLGLLFYCSYTAAAALGMSFSCHSGSSCCYG